MDEKRYIITKYTPEIYNYLNKKKAINKIFLFNKIRDLKDFRNRFPNTSFEHGWGCWENCSNFIEGVLWDGYIKPNREIDKTVDTQLDGRGWEIIRCKKFIGKEYEGDRYNKISPSKNNPRGYGNQCTWISCSMWCEDYKPNILEGEIHILRILKKGYESELANITQQIEFKRKELEEQKTEVKGNSSQH